MILQFVLDTFPPEWKLLSVSISRMSILFENLGYDSESWSDTLLKQFDNGTNNTWMKTNLNNLILLPYCTKLALFHLRFDLAAILDKHDFFPILVLCYRSIIVLL